MRLYLTRLALATCGLIICQQGKVLNLTSTGPDGNSLPLVLQVGHSNPLSAREVFETCVIPTLLYGAENWILDDGCLELLERFQAEIGRRILKLSRYHSGLAVRIGLSLPSMTSRVLARLATYTIYYPPRSNLLPLQPLESSQARMCMISRWSNSASFLIQN